MLDQLSMDWQQDARNSMDLLKSQEWNLDCVAVLWTYSHTATTAIWSLEESGVPPALHAELGVSKLGGVWARCWRHGVGRNLSRSGLIEFLDLSFHFVSSFFGGFFQSLYFWDLRCMHNLLSIQPLPKAKVDTWLPERACLKLNRPDQLHTQHIHHLDLLW